MKTSMFQIIFGRMIIRNARFHAAIENQIIRA
jgi:hypothetical protein